MAVEDKKEAFLDRWSRLKRESVPEKQEETPKPATPPVDRLTPESDFTPFMHPKVEDALGSERPVIWHLIGPVQSRKARLAAACADYFHALSREKTATRLSAALTQVNRVLPCFVEVNVSGEASKLGLDLSHWESDATQRENLRNYFRTISDLPGLAASGLMTMAPWDANPSFIRSVFRRTRELAQWLESEMPAVPRLMLSMGMTDDFEIAIEEGATHVRVGRALFGERRNQVTLGE